MAIQESNLKIGMYFPRVMKFSFLYLGCMDSYSKSFNKYREKANRDKNSSTPTITMTYKFLN